MSSEPDWDWDDAIARFVVARGTSGWASYLRDAEPAAVRHYRETRDVRLGRLLRCLASTDEKWFVAYLAKRTSYLPASFYEPMLRAAIDEPNPSFNRTFIEPCVAAVGGTRVIGDLLDVLERGNDEARAGAVNALYWAWRVPERSTQKARGPRNLDDLLPARQRRLLLTTFVENANLRLRQCIVAQLDVHAEHYPDELRPLVPQAIAIARAHEDEYIRHRIEVQLGLVKVFHPLPSR